MFKCEIWIAYPMLWPGFGKKQIQGKGNFSQCIAMPVPKIASFLQSVKKGRAFWQNGEKENIIFSSRQVVYGGVSQFGKKANMRSGVSENQI